MRWHVLLKTSASTSVPFLASEPADTSGGAPPSEVSLVDSDDDGHLLE